MRRGGPRLGAVGAFGAVLTPSSAPAVLPKPCGVAAIGRFRGWRPVGRAAVAPFREGARPLVAPRGGGLDGGGREQ